MTDPRFQKALKPGLYAITDSNLLPDDQLFSAVEAALMGGAVLIQYRDKRPMAALRLRLAQELNELCEDYRVPLIINDDPQLAHQCGASGVHLGQDDGSIASSRALLGPDAIIGVTCHGRIELARNAVSEGADYVAFGRFFNSSTKPGAPPATPDLLTEGRELGVPVVAIGGITPENASSLVQAGADMVAVVGGVFGAADSEGSTSPDLAAIEANARHFSRLFHRTR